MTKILKGLKLEKKSTQVIDWALDSGLSYQRVSS